LAKKSIVTSIRLNEDDFLKIKEVKEKYGVSWTKLIAYASELLEKDMKDTEENNNENRNLVK